MKEYYLYSQKKLLPTSWQELLDKLELIYSSILTASKTSAAIGADNTL